MDLLEQIVLFLGATVLIVPLCNYLKLGSVMGYLIAGVVIGPSVLGVVKDVDSILHFAELGVVLLLFIIGLELQPSRLWVLRRSIFGLGAAQVVITGLVLTACAIAFGIDPTTAFLVGFALALSSTAFVIQTLSEKGELTTTHGRAAFAILLFQDLAVIPLIAVLPALAESTGTLDTGALIAAIEVAAAGVLLIVLGRYFLRPVFRFVASSASHEIFDALALFIVLGVALVMEHVGISMALGAFLAGMLLADSEYRHELEADLLPFKGLLLGLFFIAVGMGTNLDMIVEQPLLILALVFGLITIKAAILFVIGRISGRSNAAAFNLSLELSQGGEFAFVLFAAAAGYALLDKSLGDTLVAVVTVSMVVSPLLLLANDRFIKPRFATKSVLPEDEIESSEHRLIMIGYGRFGQIVGRLLQSSGFEFTALESSSEQVKIVRQFGTKVYYGDASRPDLLRSAGADSATAVLIAVDDIQKSLKLAEQTKHYFPHLTIYARARNRKHAHLLMDLGITHIVRDTFHSSLAMAKEVLEDLGMPASEATHRVEQFRAHDEQTLRAQHAVHHDEHKLIQTSNEAAVELEAVLQADKDKDPDADVHAW